MRELTIYDDIGSGGFFEEGLTDKAFKAMLDEIPPEEELHLRINSDGGDVFQGQAIYNMVKRHRGQVKVFVDGIAASIASVIAMAADEVYMPINSMLMIHNPHAVVMGEASDMLAMADTLDKVKSSIIAVYAEKTGLDNDSLSAMMDAETWLLPDEAEALGFASVLESEMVVQNKIKRRFWMHNIPEQPAAEPELEADAELDDSERELEVAFDPPEPELEADVLPVAASINPYLTARKRLLEILSDDI